jgi:hypothetical protein
MASRVWFGTRCVAIGIVVAGWSGPIAAAPVAPAPQAAAAGQGVGVIEGRVLDGANGDPLPGAKVVVTGSTAETSTDRDGNFRLTGVAAGDRTVVVTYLGRKDAIVETAVTAGATRKLDVKMGLVSFEESVTVSGELILAAQERALNQQISEPGILREQ